MTERENYMRIINGELPKWVPVYGDACDLIVPSIITAHLRRDDKTDYFGTIFHMTDEGPMVAPYSPRMVDISKWQDRVNFPNLDSVDWEAMAKNDLSHLRDDTVRVIKITNNGLLFLPLVGMMGFEGALCAILTDPDEILNFNEYVTSYLEEVTKKAIQYYEPDVVILGEDIASAQDLFFSPSAYYELYRPFYKRLCDICNEAGIPIEWHICGKCERIVDDMVELGTKIWQSSQVMNDINTIKAKWGNKLAFNGCYDIGCAGALPGATEEQARQSVRDCIDNYAEGGRLIFFDGLFSDCDSMKQIKSWIVDEARSYGRQVYQ